MGVYFLSENSLSGRSEVEAGYRHELFKKSFIELALSTHWALITNPSTSAP